MILVVVVVAAAVVVIFSIDCLSDANSCFPNLPIISHRLEIAFSYVVCFVLFRDWSHFDVDLNGWMDGWECVCVCVLNYAQTDYVSLVSIANRNNFLRLSFFSNLIHKTFYSLWRIISDFFFLFHSLFSLNRTIHYVPFDYMWKGILLNNNSIIFITSPWIYQSICLVGLIKWRQKKKKERRAKNYFAFEC